MRYILLDDVTSAIVSAKRSGTTWLQTMLGAYLCRAYDLPDNLLMNVQQLTRENGLLVTAFTHDPQRAEPDARPIVEEYRDKRIVLLMRDPLDVMVSQYHLGRYRHKTVPESVTADDFTRSNLIGLLRFYEAWLSARLENLMVITYEAMMLDPVGELSRLVEFCGYPVRIRSIRYAVRFASFDKMQALERSGKPHEYYRVNDFLPVEDQRAMRTRSGMVGEGRLTLALDTLAWADELIQAAYRVSLVYGRGAKING